jgi:hypothetical protein
MPPEPGVASGMTKAMKESPTPQHRGRWYEDVGKVKRPRPVRTECCDSVRPDVGNLTNLSLVMGAGLVNFGPGIYA